MDTEVSPKRGHQVRLSAAAKAMLTELATAERRQQSKQLIVMIETYYKWWKAGQAEAREEANRG